MLRSMFTAISALTVHQEYLDVISDNLANANTAGYKYSKVQFQDQYAQTISSGSAPSATSGTGGTNPTQIGLGVKLGYSTPVFTQGMRQSTGRNLDVAIQGDGFLMYKDATGTKYSREGSLQIDSNGYLVNGSSGLRAQGWSVDVGSSETIDPNQLTGDIQIPLDQTLARATSSITFSGNLNSATAAGTATTDGGSYQTTVGVYDSLGFERSVVLTFTRDAVDADGNSVWSWAASTPTGSTYNVSGSGSLSFDSSGQAIKSTALETGSELISIDGSAGANPISVSLDLQQVTMLSSANTISAASQDGLAAGSVSDVYIGENSGEIYLLYSNGLKQLAGQIALAKFSNPSGLVRYGNSMYVEGLNSGLPQVGAPNDGTRGTLIPGYTEASNVDMAQEFTNMILAERGFQASSRVITTSDEILQELVNLKR